MYRVVLLICCIMLAGIAIAQPGDNCATAIPIPSLPFCYNGTTVGFNADYFVPCSPIPPGPDVVFSFFCTAPQVISASLCGSSFNTLLHIWMNCPPNGTLVCCNDDFCGLQSCCENVQLIPGNTYYIIVTGFAGASGNYNLHVTNSPTCPGPCTTNQCPYPNRDQEPLNNYCQEIYDTLTCGDTICGAINPLGDVDYYHIRIPGPGCQRLTIDVFGNGTPGWYPFGQGLDPIVYLMDSVSCTTYIAFDDNGGIANDAHLLSPCLRPGLYKIRIQGSGATPTMGPYILATACTPCPCDTCRFHNLDIEPINNTCDGAVALGCPDTVCGRIDNSTGVLDVDWYSVTIPAPGCQQLTINVYGNGTPGWYPFGLGLDPRVELYASNCTTLLGFDDNSGIGNDSRLISTCLQPGTYKIKVMGVGTTQGPYVLTTSCTPCQCVCPYPNRDQEPLNNYCQEIYDTLVCGDTICGAINPLGDIDYYHIRVPGPGCKRLTIDVFANGTPGWYPFGMGLDPVVYLFDSVSCTTYIASDDNGGIANDAHLLSPCLRPGLYKILIRGSGTPPTMGPYILATACSPCACDTCPFHSFDFEPGNNACNPAALPPISCPDTLCGRIDNSGGILDVDWYSIMIPSGHCEQLTINVYGNGTSGWYPYGQGLDPQVWLYASNCSTILGYDDNSGIANDSRLTSACLPAGLYMIKIAGVGATQGPYVLTTACTQCQCGCPYPNRDEEPLNNYCQEIYDTLVCGDTICGAINPLGDIDYYHIRVPGPGCKRLTIDVFANGTPGWYPFGMGLDPVVYLFDSVNCTTYIASDDNGGIANDAHLLSPCLRPGLYKILIRGSGTPPTMGPYILATACSPCACDTCRWHNLDIEPIDNTCNSANGTLACPDTICGSIQNINGILDVDWYSITIPPPACLQLTVNVYGNGTPGWYPFGLGLDPRVELFASDCTTLLGFDDNSGVGNDSRMVSPCLQPGQYKIRVRGAAGTQGPYVLTTSCAQCQCGCVITCPPNYPMDGEACPNFGPDTYNGGCSVTPPAFTPIECSRPFCATSFAMGGIRDKDWYQLNLTTPRRIRWFITASFPWEMAIYAHSPGICDTIRLRYATGLPCQTRSLYLPCLPVGTYYLYIAPSVTNGVPCSTYISRLACGHCLVHGVVVQLNSSAIQLAWDSDETLPVFNVYRSIDPDVPQLPANLIGSTSDTTFIDTSALGQPVVKSFYTVTMMDPDSNAVDATQP